jgi:hypothetical protein
MLRERIDDLDPESLRRFNVRWEITEEPSAKLTVGDPSTEQLVGKYRIREVPTWDGQFARIERGSGRVRVTRLDDDAVDVELLDTSEPALVALGTGYHPRWRATADGTPVPVYALPATSRSRTHVVAAWLRPGTTRFTPDGPLPSDGAGRMLSLLGLFAAASIISIWSRRRSRVATLRLLARLRATRIPARATKLAAGAAALLLLVWGALASRAPARALELGHGLRSDADVSIDHGGWQACDYATTRGDYRCADRAVVIDTTAAIVNDEQILWPYTTPAIGIFPVENHLAQIRIELTRRLAGRYWVGSRELPITITIDDQPPLVIDRQRIVELEDGIHEITIDVTPTARPLWLTFVREDSLVPDRVVPIAPQAPEIP